MATKYCPQCQTTVTQPLQLCPKCDAVLSLKDPYSLVGRTLLDRYQIEALVGLGGMGAVYCAFHTGIERRVAFKVLQPNIALADERLVELFEREAKVAGRLTHENIVDVKDAGRIDDNASTLAYIVMEWLDGRTLEDELRDTPLMSFAQSHEILRQTASALAEAHSKNVVHRDLKPANVMLLNRPNGRTLVKVLDFGIGKIMNETGASVSAVMGTPNYASPEQLQLGGKLDQRSDIYSLGVMLYRMLGGRLPFSSGSLADLVQMQLTATPTALRTLRPDTPAALESLVHQMLAKNPAQRPPTMQAVAAEFAAALQDSAAEESATLAWTESATKPVPAGIPVVPQQRKTELMTEAPTPRRIEIAASDPLATQLGTAASAAATNRTPNTQRRSLLVPGALLGAALVGGAFGLYRYAFNAGSTQNPANILLAQATPTVMPTVAPTAQAQPPARPSATLAPASKPESAKNKPQPKPTKAAVVANLPAPPPANIRSELPLVTSPPARANTVREAAQGQVAGNLFLTAQREYQNGNYKTALALCNRILTLHPRHRGAIVLKQRLLAGMKVLEGRP